MSARPGAQEQSMIEPEIAPDTVPLTMLNEQRRSGARYLCHIKALYNKDDKSQHQDETWNMARIIDVSTCGIALILQRHLVPGTVLALEPLLPSWHPQWNLTAKIMNLRPGPKHSWRVGCEFLEPLTNDQLQVLLQNSQ